MAKATKGGNVTAMGMQPDTLEKEVIVSKSAIVVDTKPTTKEIAIPKNTVWWETTDAQGNHISGFVNPKGIEVLKAAAEAQGLPFTYDEKKNS